MIFSRKDIAGALRLKNAVDAEWAKAKSKIETEPTSKPSSKTKSSIANNDSPAKGVNLTQSTKDRVSNVRRTNSVVKLQFKGGVNIYKTSKLSKIAFKVPSETKALIIDSVIQPKNSTNPHLYKIEMENKGQKYTGWVSAYVVYD